MNKIYNYQDPVLLTFRDGSSQYPYMDYVNVPHTVVLGKVLLEENPSREHRVQVKDTVRTYYEVENKEPTEFEFRVDYAMGVVYFNSSATGKQLSFTFKGKGVARLPASKIWTKELHGNVTETLDEIIEEGREALGNLAKITEAISKADASAVNANNKANYAQEQGDYAKLQGNYSKEQGDFAKLEGQEANQATTNANAAEQIRHNAEATRIASEDLRVISELSRDANEKIRIADEHTRKSNEDTRLNNEQLRKVSEDTRASNESTRILSEKTRMNEEDNRKLNESTRNVDEQARLASEEIRKNKEIERNAHEQTRIDQEQQRESAEKVRKSQEDTRKNNEILRQTQENERQTNTTTAIQATEYATNLANIAATKAESIAEQTVHKGVYDSLISYKINNIVSYNGSSYMCISPSIGTSPTDDIKWKLVGAKGDGVTWRGQYNGSTQYVKDDTVELNGSTYIALTY